VVDTPKPIDVFVYNTLSCGQCLPSHERSDDIIRRRLTDRAYAAAPYPAKRRDITDEHDVRWRTNATLPRLGAVSFKRLLDSRAPKTDVDFPLHVAPFLRATQDAHQLLEAEGIRGRVLKPSEEIERLAKIAALVQLTGDRGQIAQARRDVGRALFEDRAALVVSQLPPSSRLGHRNEGGAGRLRASERRLAGVEFGALPARHVPFVTRNPTQDPADAHGRGLGSVIRYQNPLNPAERRPDHRLKAFDVPGTAGTTDESRDMKWHRRGKFNGRILEAAGRHGPWLSNGSRLSCGRNAHGRKEAEPQTKRLASEATQFFPTCERPAASSAC
jgi:hypothetical protein